MILVYCENITERHRYIFDFVFGEILGIDMRFTSDPAGFVESGLPKISYSQEELKGSLHIRPHSLLQETDVRAQEIITELWKGLPVFFRVRQPSALPFDPFAMAFYLVSRYEEYLPFEPDEHGRFRPELSLAFREGFLQIPLVNAVFNEFKTLLKERFPGLVLPDISFRFIPTFDIDIAYAHLGKSRARASAAWIRLLLKADFRRIRERVNVIRAKMPDPYDNFRLHRELAENCGYRLLYFILLGDFGRYDRNVSHRNKRFRALLSELSQYAGLGIHPSYRSFKQAGTIKKEIGRLERITGKPVLQSRFHFLRLSFPQSYRELAESGISEDYSLGYSSMNGFRAGTCTPFYFFDLGTRQKSSLKLHPFLFMDSAMIDHLKLTPGEALEEIRKLTGQVMKYGGEAIGIWHNYTLSEEDQYKGWQQVLVQALTLYSTAGR